MSEDSNKEVQHEKLDQIIDKLDLIEESIFKVLENKLATFRGEFARHIDEQFNGLKTYLDQKVMGVRTDLESKFDNHEGRLIVLEKETGIRELDQTPYDRVLRKKKRKLILWAIGIGLVVTTLNAFVLFMALYHLRLGG